MLIPSNILQSLDHTHTQDLSPTTRTLGALPTKSEKALAGKVHSWRLFARGAVAARAARGPGGFSNATMQQRFGWLVEAMEKRIVMSRSDCRRLIAAREEKETFTMDG